MSGAQPIPVEQPFPKADDYIDEVTPERPMTLGRLANMMALGFNATNKRMDDLCTRVIKVESDAQWKHRAMQVIRILVPAVGGFLVARYPELEKLVPGLIRVLGGAP